MTTMCILLLLAGFSLCYSTSKKMQPAPILGFEPILGPNPILKTGLGLTFLGLALGCTLINFGVTTGIFVYLVFLMTVASLVILLAPLKLLSPIVVVPTLFILAVLENYVF